MVEKAEWPGLRQAKLPRDVSSGQGWADLECALQDLKEKNSMAAAGRRRREREGPRSGAATAAAAAVQTSLQPDMTDHLGSGDLSLQPGSSASYSTPSSSSNSRASADLDDAPNDLSPDDLSFLQDGEVRSMFKKITVNATLLNHAIERLGGGGKGIKALLGYIKLWLKEKKNAQFSISQCMESLESPHPAPEETLQMPAEMQQAPAIHTLSAAVPDYNVSTHGGHQTTMTTPAVLWKEQVESRSVMSNHGLKRLSQPFEPLHQSPESTHHLHHQSKGCRIYGGSVGDIAADVITAGFSSREAVISSGVTTTTATMGLTLAYLPASAAGSIAVRTDGNPAAHDMLINHSNSNNRAVNQQLVAVAAASCLQRGLEFRLDADNNSSISCLSPAASKRAARKIRMARQRRSSSLSSSMVSRSVAWKTDLLHLLLQKDLRTSDVGNLGRIILPKKESEGHLPSLTHKEGVFISMEDFDTRMTWSFRYRYWPNNRSRMYLLENTGEFVKAHDLEEGDLLIIYKNRQGNFVIRGKKKGLCSEAHVPTSATATTAHVPNDNYYTHSLARVPCHREIIVKKVEEEEEEVPGGKSLRVNVPPPLEDCSYKQQQCEPEPFDIFLQDVMQNEYEQCGEVLHQLERFPSLDPDVSVDDILGLTFAAGGGGVLSVVPKLEPAS